ncbi:hypothetical protein POM88_045195 [Heracleum sosnowskyi]|uniref:RSE1/DDB1/CPSF1 second beta-propeller domain-containing protein n=1 Tax=Heracleum sosnowskyi TaxID=360622 RepID=A0AAD8M4Q4_9APIA|nr:hypothetical protein POM88_045195 [Heracleum sosnowskyi]
MRKEDELEETEVKGFLSEVQTLFCHEAQYNQLIQVTSTSVRLVSFTSRELVDEWKASDKPIIVATANRKQVHTSFFLLGFIFVIIITSRWLWTLTASTANMSFRLSAESQQ